MCHPKTLRGASLAGAFILLILSTLSMVAAVHPPEGTSFNDWKSRYDAAVSDGEKQSLIGEGVGFARRRHKALHDLIKTNSQAALEMCRSVTNADSLPMEVRQEMETHFDTTGDLIIRGAVSSQGGPKVEAIQRFVKINHRTYRAYTHGSRVGGLSQTNVPVSGITLDDVAALDDLPSGSTPVNSPNPPSAYTTGGKNIIIIRVDFPDLTGAPQGYSSAQVQNIADSQVAPYYAKSSYGLTTQTNTVTSLVYRMPKASTYYATNDANDELHTNAESLASADYPVASYDRIIVYFASLGHITGSQITYGGLANVGGPDVWCNGEFDFRVIAHELGHTYGLYHGDLWQVSDGNPISASGVDTDYGDDFDTMGANQANDLRTDFCPWFKNILGWISDTQVQTITSNGTYRVYAFDHDNYLAAPGEALALRIAKNSTINYWISCRRDFTNNSSMSNGVYVQWGYNFTRTSDLLDMTTPGNSDQDAGLFLGATFIDSAAASGQGISIQPLARGGTPPNEYRDVKITFGVAPPLAPTFATQPANTSGILGATVSFIASANGNPLPTYQWQRKPNGSSAWQNVVDGGNYSGGATSNLTVTLAAVAMSGDQFQCIAANSAGTATSSPPAVLTVTSALYVSTLAGQATVGGTSNGTGTNALFFYPWDLVCDNAGNIYVSQFYNGVVRKVTSAGVVTTYASGFAGPNDLAIDANTNIYIADSGNQQVKRISPGGSPVTVLAGGLGVVGSQDGTGTGASFGSLWGIAVDSQTNIYVSDNASNTIRKITRIGSTTNWAVTTIAGTPGISGSANGTNGQASFNLPAGLACDAADNIYVADSQNELIRKITPNSAKTIFTVSTFAGVAGNYGSRNGVASSATFGYVYGLAFDAAGNLYVTDAGGNNQIRIISTNGTVSSVAGTQQTSGHADGFNTAARFNSPYGIAVDRFGNVYIADTFNYTIRAAHLAQVITPSLAIATAGANAILTWPFPTKTYRLQSITNLTQTNWSTVSNAVTTITNYNVVTNGITNSAMFYRLVNP